MPAAQLINRCSTSWRDWCCLTGGTLGRAELRPLTGREEEWVAQHASYASALLATKILSECFVRLDETPVDANIVRKLLVGDRDFLILQTATDDAW